MSNGTRSYLTLSRSDPVPYVLSSVCRQEALSVRPYLQSPGTAVRLTTGAFLPQLMERGEIESRHGRQRKRERKGESQNAVWTCCTNHLLWMWGQQMLISQSESWSITTWANCIMYFLLFHPFDSWTEALIRSRNISSYWYLADDT